MNSKKKGNKYEKEIADKLSLWISNGKTTDIFYRTHGSGSIATNNKKKLMRNQSGDITSVDALGLKLINKYIIECKNYKSLELDKMIIYQSGFTSDVVLKCYEDGLRFKKKPLCILKQMRKPSIVIAERNTWNCLSDDPLPQFYQRIKLEDIQFELFHFDELINSKCIII